MADGRVIIDTELNTKGAEKSASSLGGKLKSGLSGGLKTGAKVATSAITAVGASAIATGGALVKMAKSTAEAGDHIDKMSQKMGMSAEAYQKWDYVAKISGTSIDGLKMGFKTLTNTIDSATKGNEKALAKFQAVGVSMDDLKNKSREQIFEDTIKGLQNVSNETERSALANQLLGRAGMELGPMLNSTNGDLEKLMKTAEDYGMIMSDKAVKASAKFQDSVTTMQQTMTGLKNRLMAEFLPAMTEVTDGLALIFKGDTDAGLEKIDSGISGIVDKVTSALPKLLKIGGSIIKSIGSAIIDNLPSIINTGVKVVSSLITGIMSAIPKIVEALPSMLQVIINGLLALAPKIVESIPTLVTTIITALQQAVPILLEALPSIIETLFNGLFDLIGAFFDNLPQLVELGIKVILGLADALVKALPTLIAKLPALVQKIVDGIVNSLPLLINGAIQLVLGIVKALPQIIIALVKAMPKIIVSVVNGLIKALPLLIKGAIRMVIELVKHMPEIIFELIKAIPMIVIEIVKSLVAGIPKLITGAGKFFMGIIKAIPSFLLKVAKEGPKIPMKIIGFFKDAIPKMIGIGTDMLKGIWNGIKNAGKWVMNKIKGFVGGMVDGIKGFLGINSPSKVMADQVGKWMAYGIYDGFDKNNPMNQINKDLKTGIGAIETSINLNNALNYQRIGEAVSDGIANSNLGISLDGREFGRVVRSTI